jgi:hypothetical protein
VSAQERILTEAELNRALLARQLLLERAKGPIPRVIERMGVTTRPFARLDASAKRELREEGERLVELHA